MRPLSWELRWGCSLGTGLLLGVLVLDIGASPIPLAAARYRALLLREVHYYWTLEQDPAVFFAQVHQESGWDPAAQSRFATGLAQFTPGTAREVQHRFANALLGLCDTEAGCPLRPAWALRAMVLWDRHLYQQRVCVPEEERFAFMLADYNGGAGWINRERAYCQTTGWCHPDLYFHEVQRACGRSVPARSHAACQENTAYPGQVLRRWQPLYRCWLQGDCP